MLKKNTVRVVFALLGLVCVIIGVIGFAVPGLPGTPFILLAGFFFARSSQRAHRWLLNNPIFGKVIRDWQDKQAVTVRTKLIAISTLALTMGTSLYFFVPDPRARAVMIFGGLIGCFIVLMLPTLKR